VADEWAKLATDEPDAHRVEWFSTTDPGGTVRERVFPLPRSLADVKRGFYEQKWAGSKSWTGKKPARTNNRKYRPGEKQKPDPTVAKARKRLAARFYQLKTGTVCPDNTSRGRCDARTQPVGGANTAPRPGTTCSNTVPSGRTS